MIDLIIGYWEKHRLSVCQSVTGLPSEHGAQLGNPGSWWNERTDAGTCGVLIRWYRSAGRREQACPYSRFQSASGYLPLLRIVSPKCADRCPTDQDGKAAAAPFNPGIIEGVQSRDDEPST